LCAFSLAPLAAAPPSETPPDGFYRYPSIGGGAIVFASEGDLWKVPVGGGTAMRLTAYEGEEKFPRISPDGKWIAFTAQYEGNDDVYVMSAAGGEPKRLTYHPLPEQTLGWTADGKIVFRSRRDTPHNDYRCYTLSPAGGIPELIPLEPAAWVSFEPKGKRIALQKIGLEFHNWKRYKGGEAEQIYVGDLKPLSFKEVTEYEGKDAFPMWSDDGRIYFVTDRWGRPNLASMKPDGADVKRLTRFDDYDVRWPSMGDGKIVYQHKMDLWVYDLASGKNEQVNLQLPSDRLQVRERFVDPMPTLDYWTLSHDGERLLMETRGDIFVARTKKKGLIRRITEDSASRTQFPSFSPDGKTIAAWTEVKGEEELMMYAADNASAAKQAGKTTPGWYFPVAWSPDGKKLAYGDEKYRLLVRDAAGGEPAVVDTGKWEITRYEWSPDSRYLAYDVALENSFNQVRIWDSQTKKATPASEPMYNSFSATWDPKGKFLYYLSDQYVNPYLDRFEARFIVQKSTFPVVLALQSDGTLPFAPRSDFDAKGEEKKESEKDDKAKQGKDSGSKASKDKKKKEEKVEPIRIDFEGLPGRIVLVPVEPGAYFALNAVEGKLHWIRFEPRGMMPYQAEDEDEDQPRGDLLTYDLDKEKLSTLATEVRGYEISGDRKVLVYRTQSGFFRVEAGATSTPAGEDAKESKVDLSGWTIRIDPRQEWQQMLREAWRLQRDFFYDSKMHGVDWEAVWKQYGSLSDRMASRDDLEDVLGEMLGELSVGHAYHFPGDVRRGKTVGTGLLGADLDYDAATGFWQVKKIYTGDYPTVDSASPLARPDLKVAPGTWLVAIDGKPLSKGEDYLRRLANRAGREVELSVNASPKLEGSRRIVVKPIGNDTPIRYATWVRERRAYVEQASHGQIGYIHLYDMGGRGLRQFARDFPPQWKKPGLIIDDRWNHGGFVAPMIIEHLDRKLFNVNGTRYGNITTTPDRATDRYMAMLINRQGGSDCETLAQEFKDFKMGPVIGTRTWGGWIGIRGDKAFRDGGVTTQPEFGGWDTKGKLWIIEGHGVDPDVVLDLGPEGFMNGQDVQLDYAIKDLMTKIQKDPHHLAPAPPIVARPLITAN
jgi:tricorn protease